MELDFVQALHASTKRDYLARVTAHDKAAISTAAKMFGREYWDGERHEGYGGYRYDGRWRPIAERMAAHYGLADDATILDVGCGKGFLLYEFTQVLPRCHITGLDISAYAVDNAKPEVKDDLLVGNARDLPFDDGAFDFVVSMGTLHNLKLPDLWSALGEIERVGRGARYIMVESYRSEREKMNLMYWQLTCESFYAPDEWAWLFARAGYTGDHGFIYFE